VITDVRMPDIDGLELTARIKEKFPQIKVIIISGYQDFNYARKAVSLGVSEYIVKPLNERDITNVVGRCLLMIAKERDQQKEYEILQSELHANSEFLQQKYLTQILNGNGNAHQMERCLKSAYLSNLFCLEMGETFTRYLMKVRVQKAKQILKDPLLKVYEVGEQVGYSDIKYFTKIFKEMEGMTPAEYRERCLPNKTKIIE
jgi:two-component system response regulator YesN